MGRGALRTAAWVVLVLALAAALGAQGTDDPYRAQQWHLDHVGVPTAWRTSTGAGIVIAVVDTGVDLAHPDLEDKLLRGDDGVVVGRDFVDDDAVPQDHNGHGTMVAGVAAAAVGNGEGVAGFAADALIMPVRVLDEDGAGSGQDVDAGIRWAVDNGAHVINLSLESVVPVPGSLISTAPADAVRYAWDRGVVVVAAAGNSSSVFTDYPASSPVLLVGATDRDDGRAAFSDSGRDDAVMAPGVDIVSTWCDPDEQGNCRDDHPYGQADGTSFAAPQVSGLAAMLRASGLTHAQAVERLRETAVDIGAEGRDAATGFGRIDAAAAVGPPEEPTTVPSPEPSRPRSDATAAEEQRTPAPDPAATAPSTTAPGPGDGAAGVDDGSDPAEDPTELQPTGSARDAPPGERVTPVPAPPVDAQAATPADTQQRTALALLAGALVLATGTLVLTVRRTLL